MSSVGVIRVGVCVNLEFESVIGERFHVLRVSNGCLRCGTALSEARRVARSRCTTEKVTESIDEFKHEPERLKFLIGKILHPRR